jgi:hypothetical protein
LWHRKNISKIRGQTMFGNSNLWPNPRCIRVWPPAFTADFKAHLFAR